MIYIDPDLEQRIRDLSEPLQPIPTGVEPRLAALDDVRAVLCDVYGTLFISGSGDISTAKEQHDANAMQSALERIGAEGDLVSAGEAGLGLFEKTIHAMHRQLREQGVASPEVDILEVWRDVIEDLVEQGLISVAVSEAALRLAAIEFECRVNPMSVMPGTPDLLARFRERAMPLGIVSNAQFYTPLLFPALIGAPLGELGFDPDLCSFSFRLREAKPSPRLFEHPLQSLHEKFHIEAGEVVYVGNDMLNDIYTASSAGCRTVLFAGDRRSLRMRDSEPRCEGLKPDAVITDLSQLPGLLV